MVAPRGTTAHLTVPLARASLSPRLIPTDPNESEPTVRFASLLVVLLAGVAVAATPAEASSLVYVKASNVWLANADGSNEHQVTYDGTADDPYASPAQSNDGVIVALQRGTVHRLSQNGQALSPPFSIGGVVTSISVTPDGGLIAYSKICRDSQGNLRQCTEYKDARTGADAAPSAGQFYAPSWIDDTTAAMTAGSTVWVHGIGSDPREWWSDSDHADGRELHDIEVAPGRIALVRGTTYNDAVPELQTYAYTDTVTVPTPKCTISEPTPRADGVRTFADPTWSPDGSALAWEEGNGIWIVPGFGPDASCPAEIRGPAIPGGSEPDWGPADNAPAPRSTGGNRVATVGAIKPPKLATALRKGLTVPVSCTLSCEVGVVATVSAKTAKALKLGRRATTVGQGQRAAEPGATAQLRVKFSNKAKKRMKKARRVKLKLTILAVGDNSEVESIVRKVTLKR